MATKYKTPSQSDYSDAKARGAAAKMDRAILLASSAEKLAMEAIEEGARAVLQSGPLASEYVQTMGSWGFMVIVPYAQEIDDEQPFFYKENVGRLVEDFKKRSRDFDPEYREHVDSFIEALLTFRELHDAYEGAFGSVASGTPMKIASSGKKRTSW